MNPVYDDLTFMYPVGPRMVWIEETEAQWPVIVQWAAKWAPGAGEQGSRAQRLAEINEHRYGRYDLPPFRIAAEASVT